MPEIICPKCNGKKKRWNACFPVALSGWKPCGTCEATGAISEEKQTIIEIGHEIRRVRNEKMLDTKECAEIFGCEGYLWSKIENGESTIEDAYKARNVIEGVKVEIVEKFDVIVWHTTSSSEIFETKTERKSADIAANYVRQRLRDINRGGLVEVKPRKERTIL